ncbi:YbaK/EbsC family protein [Candidatus Parcubacteria bacterium]|nr:YbaK/EbsC family protein [Patescibacteria group bacterium]MCG2694135.1 YbaK/EbsC family protein [Candidatus Parcubacteria bacterium]
MSIPKTILNYLKKNDIEVHVEGHKKVYTAYDLAKTMNEKLNNIGKSLLVKVDGKPYLVLVPGHYHLDLGKIKKELKAKKVELASEKHVKKLLNTKLGALHPFTGIHKVELLLDKALLKSKEAIINAGSFTESLRMKTKDLHKLENARVGEFGKLVVKAGKKAVKSAPKKVKKVVKQIKKAGGQVRKAVKKASSSKAGQKAKKTAKKVYKKAMKTKAGKKVAKKVKKVVKKIEKKSPVKVNISKIPAIKRKKR